ncbi:MAG: hypothetical protein K0S68_10 [Candidatus Saccharibacteria bacterium]|jgi:hypothetical protein|nr:hypothetical protein [Candidatus Saccharibacteria bacterium]
MNLDQLRERCHVVPVNNYWVLFGDILANEDHAMVIKIDTVCEACYYCCIETTRRVVLPTWIKGRLHVSAVVAMCAWCYQAWERLPLDAPYDLLLEACWRNRARRLGLVYGGVGNTVRTHANLREDLFPDLIAQARQLLPEQPLAKPEPVSLESWLAGVNALLDEAS